MLDGYRDAGTGAMLAIGKVEQGRASPGMKCIISPTGTKCRVARVNINDDPVKFAGTGENVTLKLTVVTEESLRKGCVLCPLSNPIC